MPLSPPMITSHPSLLECSTRVSIRATGHPHDPQHRKWADGTQQWHTTTMSSWNTNTIMYVMPRNKFCLRYQTSCQLPLPVLPCTPTTKTEEQVRLVVVRLHTQQHLSFLSLLCSILIFQSKPTSSCFRLVQYQHTAPVCLLWEVAILQVYNTVPTHDFLLFSEQNWSNKALWTIGSIDNMSNRERRNIKFW
jgi:hypothetical protein